MHTWNIAVTNIVCHLIKTTKTSTISKYTAFYILKYLYAGIKFIINTTFQTCQKLSAKITLINIRTDSLMLYPSTNWFTKTNIYVLKHLEIRWYGFCKQLSCIIRYISRIKWISQQIHFITHKQIEEQNAKRRWNEDRRQKT